jgi:hypothetical protein
MKSQRVPPEGLPIEGENPLARGDPGGAQDIRVKVDVEAIQDVPVRLFTVAEIMQYALNRA